MRCFFFSFIFISKVTFSVIPIFSMSIDDWNAELGEREAKDHRQMMALREQETGLLSLAHQIENFTERKKNIENKQTSWLHQLLLFFKPHVDSQNKLQRDMHRAFSSKTTPPITFLVEKLDFDTYRHIKMLLDLGVDPNPGNHPLPCAFRKEMDLHKKNKTIQLLLDYGSDINYAQDGTGFLLQNQRRYYFFQAAAMGNKQMMKQLLVSGDASLLQNETGHALFYVLYENGQWDTVNFLLEQGADPYYETWPVSSLAAGKISPIQWLKNRSSTEILQRTLLEKIINRHKELTGQRVIRMAQLLMGKSKKTVEREKKRDKNDYTPYFDESLKRDPALPGGAFPRDIAFLTAMYRYNYHGKITDFAQE